MDLNSIFLEIASKYEMEIREGENHCIKGKNGEIKELLTVDIGNVFSSLFNTKVIEKDFDYLYEDEFVKYDDIEGLDKIFTGTINRYKLDEYDLYNQFEPNSEAA